VSAGNDGTRPSKATTAPTTGHRRAQEPTAAQVLEGDEADTQAIWLGAWASG
jgi:hypothetical protein